MSLPTSASITIGELLALFDQPFVATAYRCLLGREIDPAGEQFYVARLREGVSREQVLWEILQSAEARERGPVMQGQAEFLERMRRRQRPGLLERLRRNEARELQLNRVEHMLGTLRQQMSKVVLDVNHCVWRADELRRDVEDVRNGRWAGLPTQRGETAAPAPFVAQAPASLPPLAKGLFQRLRPGSQAGSSSVG